MIGLICLHSWKQQNQQVNDSVNEYLPKIQTAIHLDETLNTLFFEFNEFLQSSNTASRLTKKEQIKEHLANLSLIASHLSSDNQLILDNKIETIQGLLSELDTVIANNLLIKEKLAEIKVYMYWLHNDFVTELSSLLQDISWQQNSLLEHLKQNPNSNLHNSFEALQDELNAVSTLNATENDIVNVLNTLIDGLHFDNTDSNINYLMNLKSAFQDSNKNGYPTSTITLQQITLEMFQIVAEKEQLPLLLKQYKQSIEALQASVELKNTVLNNARNELDNQLNNQHKQLKSLNSQVKKASNFSVTIIMLTTVLALLFIVIFIFFYIRPKILSRFSQLNHAVIELSKGNLDTPIPIYGQDELARIADLLKKTITQINTQTMQLQAEITERIEIEKDLRTIQDDLIQAAKLAVVGQTMTTLAHEINQPLNAINIYLFTAQSAIEKDDTKQAMSSLNQIKLLSERMGSIVHQFRQYSKRSDGNQPLVKINLDDVIQHAWSIISLNKTYHISLDVKQNLGFILGNTVRVEQVLINIFTNTIEACRSHNARIEIESQEDDDSIKLYIKDNGPGWDLQLADKLLKPFSTNKDIGLGIGLSLSQSIMQQNQGDLQVASTLEHNAMIILTFRKYHVNE
ncbi:ATP-binding protein [Orbaceae bacterium ac157xtp]